MRRGGCCCGCGGCCGCCCVPDAKLGAAGGCGVVRGGCVVARCDGVVGAGAVCVGVGVVLCEGVLCGSGSVSDEEDEETRKKYGRGYPVADEVKRQASGEALQDVTLFDLIAAFKKVLTDIDRKNVIHRVEKVEATLEQQTEYILNTLQKNGKQSFLSLCASFKQRVVIAITFLAVLEMIKEQQIRLYLEDNPSEFYVDLMPVSEILHQG